MGRRVLFVIFMLMNFFNSFGQDPEFSQFYANPLFLNPGFTGTTELPRTTLNYRNQWPQKGQTYTTYSVSYDKFLKKVNGGVGFQLIHDRELNNVINSNSASFFYSYHIKLSEWTFMTAGLQAGLVYKQFDPTNLVFPSMINQLNGNIYGPLPAGLERESKIYPDFGVGVVGQSNDVYWGVSINHLTKPNESILPGDQKGSLPRKITVNLGARTHKLHRGLLSREFTLSPNIIYQQQGSFKQLNLGMYMIEKSVMFGAWFRNNISARPDALIGMVGFAKTNFKIGYSFDYTLSKLSNYSYGSHEISLVFFMGKKAEVGPRQILQIPAI